MMDARDSTGTAGQMPVVVARSRDRGRLQPFEGCACASPLCPCLCWRRCLPAASAGSPTHVSHLTTPANPAKADAIIVLTGGQSRLDAAIDLLTSGKGERLLISGVHPSASRRQLQAATGGDKATVFLLRRHRPRRARHDRQCRGKRQMGREPRLWHASSWSPTTITCRAACWKCAGCCTAPSSSPIRWSTANLDNGGWLTKPRGVARAVHRIHKYLLALARGIVPPGHRRAERPDRGQRLGGRRALEQSQLPARFPFPRLV